jgi:hypothetical protein
MSNHHKISNSTSIEHIDYHEPYTLEIKFISGTTYHYSNCPKDYYEQLKTAVSAGKYFQANILNKFAHKKV